jgi:hypothetical protein
MEEALFGDQVHWKRREEEEYKYTKFLSFSVHLMRLLLRWFNCFKPHEKNLSVYNT